LEEIKESNKKDRDRVLNTLSAAARWFIEDKAPPEMTWKHEGDKFSVNGGKDAKAYRIWSTDSETRDFRKAKWSGVDLKSKDGGWAGELERPKTGFRAVFAECEYDLDGLKYMLSTQIRILEPAKK